MYTDQLSLCLVNETATDGNLSALDNAKGKVCKGHVSIFPRKLGNKKVRLSEYLFGSLVGWVWWG